MDPDTNQNEPANEQVVRPDQNEPPIGSAAANPGSANQATPAIQDTQPITTETNQTNQQIDPNLNGPGRFPSFTPSMVEFGDIPSAPKNISGNTKTFPNKDSGNMKHPNQMLNMSMVTMTSKAREAAPKVYYSNYVENQKRQKIVKWDEAMSARPPLRIDMDGPTACSYSPRNKPLYETNAPSWSFGRKTFVEKPGGSRTSWEKTWFQNPDVWTQKADFFSDRRWPAPPSHKQKPMVGKRLASVHTAPHHTFGYRRENSRKGTGTEPSPNDYDIGKADSVILPKSPAFSHSYRRGGTCLWSFTEITPGPGTYKPETSYRRIKTHHPSFSIRGVRREKTHELGPFATF